MIIESDFIYRLATQQTLRERVYIFQTGCDSAQLCALIGSSLTAFPAAQYQYKFSAVVES